MTKKITLTKPDDWHCHFRDNEKLSRTVIDTSARFQRAIIMPNLSTPITTVPQAKKYLERIQKHIPKNISFQPLMTLYLHDEMDVQTIRDAKQSGFIVACKLYPAGATTHSKAGVTNLEKIYSVLEAMQKEELLLLLHGESIDPAIDIFDREKIFIEKQLKKLLKQFPNLRMVLEHISTKTAVEFVKQTPKTLAATITPHHLLLNRNDLLLGGIRPHYYCLPIVKRKEDQKALIEAATSGNPKFFLGTDSAPHAISQKENACGCAGIYSSHAAIELYAEIFEEHGVLNQLESFACLNGANFYRLPINKETITLVKESWKVPEKLSFGKESLIPLAAGKMLRWKINP